MALVRNKGRLRALARQPFGPWERREITPEMKAAWGRGMGTRLSPEMHAVRVAYVNNRYSVQVSTQITDWGDVTHLWIRRHDSERIHSWADLQRIKNEVRPDGHERTAVEVYPRDAELVDVANMYHLWVLPPGFALPFTLRSSMPAPGCHEAARG